MKENPNILKLKDTFPFYSGTYKNILDAYHTITKTIDFFKKLLEIDTMDDNTFLSTINFFYILDFHNLYFKIKEKGIGLDNYTLTLNDLGEYQTLIVPILREELNSKRLRHDMLTIKKRILREINMVIDIYINKRKEEIRGELSTLQNYQSNMENFEQNLEEICPKVNKNK